MYFLRNNVTNKIKISENKDFENLFNKMKTDSKKTQKTITILNSQQKKNKSEIN